MKKVIVVLFIISFFTISLYSKDKILVKFNGGIVTQKDVDMLLNEIPAPFRKLISKNADFEKQALLLKLISMEYKNKKIDENTLRKIELCKNRILMKKYFSDKLKNIKVSENEIKDYYKKHQQQYNSQISYLFKLIVFDTEKEAKKIFKAIKNGEKFEKFSKGNFYHNYILEKNLPKVFREALKRLKKGEISNPLKFNNKYYIVKLMDKKIIPGKSFKEVKESIRKILIAEKKQSLRKKIEEDLFKKYQVKFLK